MAIEPTPEQVKDLIRLLKQYRNTEDHADCFVTEGPGDNMDITDYRCRLCKLTDQLFDRLEEG